MKKLLPIFLFACLSATAQKSDYAIATENKVSLVPDKVDLHMKKYEDQMRTGKGFLFTGSAIIAIAGGIVIANDKNQNLGMATGMIGGVFQLFGFFNIADARRHLKKAWAAERIATR